MPVGPLSFLTYMGDKNRDVDDDVLAAQQLMMHGSCDEDLAKTYRQAFIRFTVGENTCYCTNLYFADPSSIAQHGNTRVTYENVPYSGAARGVTSSVKDSLFEAQFPPSKYNMAHQRMMNMVADSMEARNKDIEVVCRESHENLKNGAPRSVKIVSVHDQAVPSVPVGISIRALKENNVCTQTIVGDMATSDNYTEDHLATIWGGIPYHTKIYAAYTDGKVSALDNIYGSVEDARAAFGLEETGKTVHVSLQSPVILYFIAKIPDIYEKHKDDRNFNADGWRAATAAVKHAGLDDYTVVRTTEAYSRALRALKTGAYNDDYTAQIRMKRESVIGQGMVDCEEPYLIVPRAIAQEVHDLYHDEVEKKIPQIAREDFKFTCRALGVPEDTKGKMTIGIHSVNFRPWSFAITNRKI